MSADYISAAEGVFLQIATITDGEFLKRSGTTIVSATVSTVAFSTIAVSGQSDVVADSATDTLTLAAGTGIAITTNAGSDTVTIATSGLPTVAFTTVAVSGQSDVVADSASDTLTLAAGTGIAITTNAGTDTVTITATGAANSFTTISVSGQSDVVADSATDTLTLAAGGNITITTNAATDAVTIAVSGLGTMAIQDANNVSISGGSVTGITDIAVADGGTGRSSHTAYAVICGGTSTTAAQQSVASVGTSGQVLTSNGASALPTFQDAASGDWVKISSATASSSSSITFTGLSNTYAAYKVVIDRFAPATDGVSLWLRTSTNNGSSYDSGASDYRWTHFAGSFGTMATAGSTADAKIILAGAGGNDNIGNATNEHTSGEILIINPSAAAFCTVNYDFQMVNSAGNGRCAKAGGGVRVTAADVDAIQLLMSSGNIASGTATLYGLKA